MVYVESPERVRFLIDPKDTKVYEDMVQKSVEALIKANGGKEDIHSLHVMMSTIQVLLLQHAHLLGDMMSAQSDIDGVVTKLNDVISAFEGHYTAITGAVGEVANVVNSLSDGKVDTSALVAKVDDVLATADKFASVAADLESVLGVKTEAPKAEAPKEEAKVEAPTLQAVALDPESHKPLYVNVNGEGYTQLAHFAGENKQELFTFNEDVVGQAPKGTADKYTGPIFSVPAQ